MPAWYLADPDPSVYWREPWFALDFETSNKEKGSPLVPENRVVLAAVYHKGLTSLGPVRDILPPRGILVAHNAKFELAWLNRLGMDTSQYLVWDTLIGDYVRAGNRRWALDLGSVCRRYGLPAKEPVIDSLMSGGVCPSEMPAHLLEARVRRDVETTGKLFEMQRKLLTDEGLLACMYTRCILTPVLAEIEATGLFVDKAAVSKETRRVLAELRASEARLGSMTGGINLRSTAQSAHHIYGVLGFKELTDRRGNPKRNAPTKQFPQGLPKTDSDTLDKLEATTEEQRAFVKARGEFGDWNARYTKSLAFLETVAKDHGGLFYGRFNQAVTQTHRLSSSGRKVAILNPETGKTEEKGIQFQNLPREYKKLFTAREKDYVYVEIDGSQLEFRVAAFLGQDQQAARDIIAGADIHRFTASVLNGIPEEKVTKKQRTEAKANTFKPLYGGQSGTKREVAYYEAFREKYKDMYAAQKGWVAEVLKSGKLVTVTGLTFYWPGTKVTSSGYVENTPSIFNFPVQSLATADIIPIATTLLFWAIKQAGLRAVLCNSVHDSVSVECHKDDVEKLRELAERAFLEGTYEYLDRVFGIKLNIPLGVAVTAGTHWGLDNILPETQTSRGYEGVEPLVK